MEMLREFNDLTVPNNYAGSDPMACEPWRHEVDEVLKLEVADPAKLRHLAEMIEASRHKWICQEHTEEEWLRVEDEVKRIVANPRERYGLGEMLLTRTSEMARLLSAVMEQRIKGTPMEDIMRKMKAGEFKCAPGCDCGRASE